MLGLLVMILFAIYWLICLIVIKWGIKLSRELGHKGWKGGVIAAFIMYNLVFWDLIPVYVVHSYQCSNNAGFTVNKTLEQWKADNPGVAETLRPFTRYGWHEVPDIRALPPKAYLYKEAPGNYPSIEKQYYRYPSGYIVVFDYLPEQKKFKDDAHIIKPNGEKTEGYYLNARFAEIINHNKVWHVIRKTDEKIVDLKTGEVLAEYSDFDGNPSSIGIGANTWNDYKFWLAGAESCERSDAQRTKPINFEFNKFMYLMQHQKEFKQ